MWFVVIADHPGDLAILAVVVDGGNRRDEDVFHGSDDEEHLGSHFRRQLVVAVVHVDQHSIQYHPVAAVLSATVTDGAAVVLVALVRRLGRHQENLPDPTDLAPAFAAENREVGQHVGPGPADIGFRNLGPDSHRRQFDDPQDRWGLLLDIGGPVFARINCYHRTGHWRVGVGMAEFGFIVAQRGLGLADLRLIYLNPRLSGEHLHLGALHILGTHHAAGGQPLLASAPLAGEGVLGMLPG